ncbi:hypothetical protein G6F46_004191 [Rhizopus delemar]|uniref:Uncharacterized protein n=2 Tax=Rhizopus TaxID=4842 RepID=A0A9P7CTP1_9FUNG|nr:hypothetical protein G6F43_012570 [Rhizopus delemar]KAG1547069.1 hypothetical protein G6F51_004500 [Rhizopus arrhizus]KAG1460959.1 hypothetical protein G6F55_003848 [Rhizopus delemar]KAG1500703.1 hypothetical protein G6F54_003542 [Rhizopus delemar]KAG1508342.1 hypothetical protein G6F52_011415 [Rhizopus delemar]
MLKRITEVDWNEGLYAIQVAQLEMQSLTSKLTERKWKIIEIVKNSGQLDLTLDIKTLQQHFDSFLSSLQDCYVYAYNNKEMDTYWFYLKFYTDSHIGSGEPMRSKRQSGFLVYYPETAYLLVHSSWAKDMHAYVSEAILNAFSADKLVIQRVAAAHIQDLTKQIMNKRSLGVFSQLRNNQTDANPLDIRQKRPKGFEDIYVSPGEKRRRIVPVDIEEMKARYEAINNYFGPDEIISYRSLDIEATEDMEVDDENEENNVQIDMNLKGTNVVEGLRQMVLAGTIQSPLPPWLENVAASVASKIYINKDGVSKEEYEEDSDNEKYTIESIMAEQQQEEED